MPGSSAPSPDWDQLFEMAAGQDGLFTTKQAAQAGYSPQLLSHHAGAGRIARIRRGVYRIVHFPAGDHEDLTSIWLWSRQAGVFSHQTALALHGLSDALPSMIHLIVPVDWRGRRLRIPHGVVISYAEVPKADRTWFGPVPTTAPGRTLIDCADAGLSPDLLRDGALQALGRGLVTREEIGAVEAALLPFGGLSS